MTLDQFRRKYPLSRLTIDGLTWQVIEAKAKRKDAPALLLLPGTLGTAEIFWRQIAALAGEVHVVSVTYPMTADIARLAEGAAKLLTRLGIDRATVAGSSLGGYLAQWVAARHPDRVAGLSIGNSLSDPAIINPTGRRREDLGALPAAVHRGFILDSVRAWPEPEPIFTELKDILLDSGTRLLSARALKARVLAVQRGGAVPPLMLKPSRILVIDCADDPLIARAVQDDVVARYPKARHLRMKVGGHYPYIVRPEAYTEALRKLIAASGG